MSQGLANGVRSLQADWELAQAKKAKLDELKTTSSNTQGRTEELEKQEADLVARLERTRKDLPAEKRKLNDLPKLIEDQQVKLKALNHQVANQRKNIKHVIGSDADGMHIINEVDQIRL